MTFSCNSFSYSRNATIARRFDALASESLISLSKCTLEQEVPRAECGGYNHTSKKNIFILKSPNCGVILNFEAHSQWTLSFILQICSKIISSSLSKISRQSNWYAYSYQHYLLVYSVFFSWLHDKSPAKTLIKPKLKLHWRVISNSKFCSNPFAQYGQL